MKAPSLLATLFAVGILLHPPLLEAQGSDEVSVSATDEPLKGDARGKKVTTYWKVSVFVRMEKAGEGTHVRMLLPLSDGRQRILSRRVLSERFSYREETDDLNLWGRWTGTAEGQGDITYEWAAAVSDAKVQIPVLPLRGNVVPAEMRADLTPTPLIQSDHPEIRTRARNLTKGAKSVDEIAWALYQFTAAFLKTDPAVSRPDALSVLRQQGGNRTGKARLLAAMLRSLGIPARIVGGLQLGNAAKKKTTIAWVEAYLGGTWVPMDPAGGYFAWLPNTYLTLYRTDLPLIVHSANISFDYHFLIRQVTRKAVIEDKSPVVVKVAARPDIRLETDRVRTIATYVEQPVATVVLIADQSVPEGVIDQILTEAKNDEINIVLLNARFESRYFRENYLQRLVSNNLTLIREAHLLLVATTDEAGLYALLELGEKGMALNDARIVVAGNFPRPVGHVLGSVLYELIDPGELVLVNRQTDLLLLWEVARANLIHGIPMMEGAQKWGVTPLVLDEGAMEELSGWRRALVKAWSGAVRAQVPLQALNLILILPVIALLMVVARNVVGVETFGTFSPILVSLAFLATGLWWGVAIFVVIVGLGAALRMALQRLRLHLVSRLAILIALVAVSMVGLTVVGAYFGIGALINVSIFPMIIMSHVIENFTTSQLEFGTREAVRLTINTLILSVVSYWTIEGTGLQSVVLAFPEVLAGVLIVEVLLGKWRGLRLLEYLRFYDLVRDGRVRWPV